MKETFFLQHNTLEELAAAIDGLNPETETLLSPIVVFSFVLNKYYVTCQREVQEVIEP